MRERLLVAWQARLVDLMEEDPTAAEAVRLLSGELQAKLPAARQQWIQNVTAAAPGATAQGVMFGNIVNHPAPGEPPREREAPF
ncbi:hypothetical protein ABGB07_26540 [Micromonosporaceae bacterium B7E4]